MMAMQCNKSPSRWREGLGVGLSGALGLAYPLISKPGQAHPRPLPPAGGEL